MAITCKDGRSQLYISQCTEFDVGFYKVVARNCNGQATHRFRLVRGEIPGMSDPPELEKVSGTQVLLKWRTPIEDGGAAIEKYNLQIKPAGEIEWKSVNDSIQYEIYLVENLNPLTAYQFRVASKNIRGWGEFSVSTPAIRTGNKDDPRIEMPVEQGLQQKHPKLQVLQLPGARGEIRDLLDYGRETQHVLMKEGEGAMLQMKKYKMAYEISRGRFSSVMRCIRHDDQKDLRLQNILKKRKGRGC
ncbi:Kalirin [Armadillidium vulgare]|nr:Kalirin [Armadillidium vulgare]